MDKLIFATLLAAVLSVAISPSVIYATTSNGDDDDDNGNDSILKAKPSDKAKKTCQVKVQVKLFDAVNGTIYNVQLDNLLPQAKQAVFNQTEIDAGDNNLAFNFQYKKGGDDNCPSKGDVEEGNVNGSPFVVLINSLTKVNKVGVDLTQ